MELWTRNQLLPRAAGTSVRAITFAGLAFSGNRPRKTYQTTENGRAISGHLQMSPQKTKSVKQPSIADFEITIGPPKLTRFERARIVGARSLQVAMGAPAFVPLEAGYKGPIEIATAELEEDALPISIRRSLPNGAKQDIPIRALSK